jgi:hypothetical protein
MTRGTRSDALSGRPPVPLFAEGMLWHTTEFLFLFQPAQKTTKVLEGHTSPEVDDQR